MKTPKISAHNAPAFCRHLQTLSQLAGIDAPYPFELYATLLRLERKANRLATMDCNGEGNPEEIEKQLKKIENKVRELLPNVKTFFINGDPRGYSLKIGEAEAKELGMWSDWGSYGILAPEF